MLFEFQFDDHIYSFFFSVSPCLGDLVFQNNYLYKPSISGKEPKYTILYSISIMS